MIILITGASGAIGAHLAKRLLDEGHEVISIKHDEHPFDTSSLIGVRDRIVWAKGSILDERFVKRVVADYAPEVIYHLAALPITQAAMRSMVPVFTVNLMGTIHLLEAVKESNWAGKNIRLIFQSTDKAYGEAGSKPYTEDQPLNALAPYDCSKACADQAVRTYAACGFVKSAAVARSCNIIAEGDLNFNRVFPRTIIPSMRGEPPSLYRTDYLREFMYVEDAVSGLITIEHLLSANSTKWNGHAFNVGSGEQRTLPQCVEQILRHFPGIEPNWTEAPPLSRIEIPYQALDTAKLHQAWPVWVPRYTFEETISRLVAWWREHWNALPVSVKTWRATGWHG